MGLDMNLITNSRGLSKVMSKYWADDDYMAECCVKRGEIGYWRKFSALHNWMVTNVQYGEDDCGMYEVIPSKLFALYDVIKTCDDMLEDYELAANGDEDYIYDDELTTMIDDMFPMTTGFFFNPPIAWEWNVQNIRNTRKWMDTLFDNLYYDKEKDSFFFVNKETLEIDVDWEVRFWYNSSW